MRKKHSGKWILPCVAILLLAGIAAISIRQYTQSGDAALEREAAAQEQLYGQLAPETAQDGAGNYLADAQAVNPDIVAWITIPDTNIDFPVVQTEDNRYYLSHDFEKQSSDLGVPFLDYRNASDFSDFNSIVYGHHITRGRLFANLTKFKDADFFAAHPTGTLTLSDRICTVEFFCSAVVNSDCEIYGEICVTKPQKTAFLETLSQNAVCTREYDTDRLLEENLLVLSTCSYEYEDARTILVGVLQQE